LPAPPLPVVAIPTTAGTGSEVSAVAIIEDPSKHLKLAVSSNLLRPRLGLVDPLLTLSCPPKVTAESGIDALTHAIEAYTNIDHRALPIPNDQFAPFAGKYPLTDVLAEKAIKLVGENLRVAVYQPNNVDAREAMCLAATLGGMAFSNAGVGIIHALQYPIGAITHTSHGLGNGLMLPYVMAYLQPSNPAAFADIAAWLGAAHGDAVAAVHKLKAEIGIPARLSEIGIKAEHLRGIAETAASNGRLMPLSPRTVNADVLEMILKSAL
jgi:alcohol dehydrogenase class IV